LAVSKLVDQIIQDAVEERNKADLKFTDDDIEGMI